VSNERKRCLANVHCANTATHGFDGKALACRQHAGDWEEVTPPDVPSAPRHDAGTGDHPAPTCECGARLNLKGQTKCADCIDRMIASAPPSPGGEDVGAGDEAVATGRGWFSYDPEDGVDFHATEREAREAADRALDMERDSAADGGWNENAVDICYGRVYGSARQVSATPTPGGEFDEIVDYGIVDDLPREESPGYLRAAVSRLAADVERLTRELEAARNKEGK